MVIFRAVSKRLRGLFRHEPQADAWVLPWNEVTRAIESGRDLADYAERPAAAVTVARPVAPSVETFALDIGPVFEEPKRKIVISDDAVHGAAAEAPLVPSEKPLEETKGKKRWWRRAA